MIQSITPAAYHAAGRTGPISEWYISKSFLWDFAKSPFAWKQRHDRGEKREITASMDWGSAVDCLATTPELYSESVWFHDADSWQGKAAQLFREAARVNGKIPMLEKDRVRIAEAAAMLAEHFQRHGLDKARTQTCGTTTWMGPSGRQCAIKALADFLDPLADLKTTNSLDVRDIARAIRDFGYHWQAALYLDVFRANGMDIPEEFPLHFQESSEPFRTRVWHLTPEDIAAGRQGYQAALIQWDSCLTFDKWPGRELDSVTGRNAIYQNETP